MTLFFSLVEWDTSCMLHILSEKNTMTVWTSQTHTAGWSINDEWCWTILYNIEQQEKKKKKKSFLVSSSFLLFKEEKQKKEEEERIASLFSSLHEKKNNKR